ncbi:hypothetical protein QYB42_002785 [Clostridium perfringens]|nr:hypothetical protein [Clostridium perfringens]MDU3583782.1 hypothetical protein [Clostridium butyricum]
MNDMKINDKFIVLPNRAFRNEYGEPLAIKYKDKFGEAGKSVALIYAYLEHRRTYLDECYFSIEDMIRKLGCKPETGKGRMNDNFKNVLNCLKEDGYIKTSIDFTKTNINKLITVDLIRPENNFFKLEQYQYEWIMNSKSKSKKNNLFKLFCAIKSRIATRHKIENIYDGMYEVAFPSYITLSKDTGIGQGNIKKYIDELVEMKLIKYSNLGTIYNQSTGETKECNNTYAIYKKGWEEELNGSIRLLKQKLKEDGWKLIKKEPDKNIDSLKGRKGYLTKQINKGIATQEEIEEYKQIENKLEKRRQNKKQNNKTKEIA